MLSDPVTGSHFARTCEFFAGTSHGFPLVRHLLCLAYVGSHSHGTYVPSTDPDCIDDVGLMGVLAPPASYVLGLDQFEHWVCQREELDVTVYSLHKFVRLLLQGNPNVLGLLWLRDEDYLLRTASFLRLQENRRLFMAKSVYRSFAGYAQGQLHKMTSYSSVIQARIDHLTERLEWNGWHLQDVMDKRSVPMPRVDSAADCNSMADELRRLRAKYHSAYQGEKRRSLVRRHGYDTKSAAHLVRLLWMCAETMRTGEVRVYRDGEGGGAEVLREIKRGEWALEHVKVLAEELFARCKVARDASTLPEEPDVAAINELLVQINGHELDYASDYDLPTVAASEARGRLVG